MTAVFPLICTSFRFFGWTGCNQMAARILVVDHRTPTPDQDSGSASTFSYLQILSEAGFDVTFLPSMLKDAGSYSEAIRALGIIVPTSETYPSLDAAIDLLAPRADLVILFRAPVAHLVFERVRKVAPKAKILFHAVDLHHVRMRRQAELAGNVDMGRAAEAMRTIELDLATRADATVVVSAFEHDLLRGLVADAPIHHIPILRSVPVDDRNWLTRLSAFFRCPYLLRQRRDIVFVGGFEHAPNGDGIRWFVSHVWPKVVQSGIGGRLVIAGSNLPSDIAALASHTIATPGYVGDLGVLFATARMSIAPLRYGAGVKGKIVSSLSHHVPVVATRIAAEGTGLVDGVNVLIGDDPQEKADAIIRLYRDDGLWWRLSKAGYRTFIDVYSHDSGRSKIMKVINELLQ